MDTLQFKTNIKCGGCIATVKPHLDQLAGVKNWEVDTLAADKILTVEASGEVKDSDIINTLSTAGFNAERI
ncbi:heavy-metal-associated domain-containing protein [Pedobacter antarcticus]|uniref:HMA domain-containing protein n=2 Tax=Pedobacter antarcticus TaxID=34086 RepID=A0A081PDG2_9SPHI|nr:cation transporter [Pedobacter antarcticus]KEQ28735.1 hypothetical protein N180_20325 [Pedobacter antarcticus 4BY]SDL44391.1 Heavy-metal-associated domain-containing protein [Pedobacter antarcticus]SFE40296.1 Heavy-metal-associated domain-containing protein [Pedobacter antarcticus]